MVYIWFIRLFRFAEICVYEGVFGDERGNEREIRERNIA
jgi:hypothetical protein